MKNIPTLIIKNIPSPIQTRCTFFSRALWSVYWVLLCIIKYHQESYWLWSSGAVISRKRSRSLLRAFVYKTPWHVSNFMARPWLNWVPFFFNFVFQDRNGLLLVVRQKRVITRETREVGGRRCPLEKRETRAIRDDLARRRYKTSAHAARSWHQLANETRLFLNSVQVS